MPSSHAESAPRVPWKTRAALWLLPAALLALVPKCMLCVLAYTGVGAALGISGVEWCRADETRGFAWTSALAWSGVGIAAAFGLLALRCRKPAGGRHGPAETGGNSRASV